MNPLASSYIRSLLFGVMCSAMFGQGTEGWTQLNPTTNPTVYLTPMAYDALHDRMVQPVGSQVYLFDGSQWTVVTPAHPLPSDLTGYSIAYDGTNQNVVLFGGISQSSGSVTPNTYIWNGSDWTNMNITSGPSLREGAGMVYDGLHEYVLLFGGYGIGSTPGQVTALNDTWAWNGSAWSYLGSSGPSPRINMGMAFDTTHQQVILFGGVNSQQNYLSDTWQWTDDQWTPLTPSNPPAGVIISGLVNDTRNGGLLLYGAAQGNVEEASPFVSWNWNGSAWTQLNPSVNPGAREFPSMAYDSARQVAMLVGGITIPLTGPNAGQQVELGDTWVWGPVSGTPYSTGGTPQSALAGQPFPFSVQATVLEGANLYSPVASPATVTFSGPSQFVTFPNQGVANTGPDGRASITPVAGSTAGSYLITATTGTNKSTTFVASTVNTNRPAGSCVVTSAGDDNSPGTLRYQIAACGKGGTITFSPSITTVQLAFGEIPIIQDLTIDGTVPTTLETINAGGLSRAFCVNGGTLILKNLVIENGSATGGAGGAGSGSSETGPGGGAAGMGGAIFVNGGNLITNNITLSQNVATGGAVGPIVPAAELVLIGAGGGTGGPSVGVVSSPELAGLYAGNGGGGGALGGAGSTISNSNAGTGGGGFFGGVPGFGGGGAPAGESGFGGGGFDPYGFGGANGGGAGLGGAIFAYTGNVLLENTTFTLNTVVAGVGLSSVTSGAGPNDPVVGSTNGAGLFVYPSANAVYVGPTNSYVNDSNPSFATSTSCQTLNPNAMNTLDVCGVVNILGTAQSGQNQSAAPGTAFAQPLTLSLNNGGTAMRGLPIVFTAPSTGASITTTSTTVYTDSTGTASLPVTANGSPGLYNVTASIPGTTWTYTYPLTNTPLTSVNETSNVKVTYTGAVYNRSTKLYSITFTIANTSDAPLAGPLELLVTGLPGGVTASNNAGVEIGSPYWTATANSLGAGASVQVQATFSNPSGAVISFSPQIFSGAF